MPALTFRIVDAVTFEVLADVQDESQIETFLLANTRYIESRTPFKDVTVINTIAININKPYSSPR